MSFRCAPIYRFYIMIMIGDGATPFPSPIILMIDKGGLDFQSTFLIANADSHSHGGAVVPPIVFHVHYYVRVRMRKEDRL